jgi:hypothetical protein
MHAHTKARVMHTGTRVRACVRARVRVCEAGRPRKYGVELPREWHGAQPNEGPHGRTCN